jgi:starvation-inducible outer membrane lipoprotein
LKLAILSLALWLAACASPPPTTPATAGSLAPASEEEEIRLAVQEAVEKGYKVVTEQGQTLYCRKDLKTGSRVQSNVTCLTDGQLAAQRRGAIDYVNNIQKGNPNPLPDGSTFTKP